MVSTARIALALLFLVGMCTGVIWLTAALADWNNSVLAADARGPIIVPALGERAPHPFRVRTGLIWMVGLFVCANFLVAGGGAILRRLGLGHRPQPLR